MDSPSRPEGNGIDLAACRSGVLIGAAVSSLLSIASGQDAKAATTITNLHNAPPCTAPTYFALGQRCLNAGKVYQDIVAGKATSLPTGKGSSISAGGAVFKYLSDATVTSWSQWTASLPRTLTNPQKLQFGNDLPGTAWNGGLTLSGVHTRPTADITITSAPGEGFADNPNRANNKLRFDPSNGVALASTATYTPVLNIATEYVTITNIQTRSFSVGKDSQGIKLNAVNATVTNCILMDNGHHDSGPLSPGWLKTGVQITVTITNNIFVQASTLQGISGRGIIMSHVSGDSRIEGNTFVLPSNYGVGPDGFAIGGSYNASSLTIRNNAFFGFASPLGFIPYGSRQMGGVSDGHNATDQPNLGVAGGNVTTGNLTRVPLTTATFMQPSNTAPGGLDLRLTPGSPLQRAGSSAVVSNTDIIGNPRTAGAFDIGAFQRTRGR